jgi:hypothetical protein
MKLRIDPVAGAPSRPADRTISAAAVSLLEPCEVETLAFHIQRVSEDRAKVDVEFVLDERMGTDTTGITPPFSWETRGRTSDQRARGR